ncbi:S-adenosyl-L-methionine-dependent methyltransferase [Coprinellus micaceus]|uniref:S-adenosyl-L-methionine-dependent methyltransferase n=1 Tax=Coprinellus micaceus TaxID=71717 RepID=A0A4Y7SWB7_COPMI|nr:S-adenosyl-L-methionine-dependent methyltransferase [Coprinellus micaceus]
MATSEVYQLPVDEEERDRLRKQHHMLISIMRAKYPPFMERVLASTIPGEKRVLDLGCGNGEWISDVARDFPFCECVAIDLVPIRDSQGLPPNVKTEVDDVNLGLQHCYGQFDVVHVRLIASGVKDYQLLIEDISRILRPGGVMELCEFDFSIYNQNHHPFTIHLHEPMVSPYWARWMAHLRRAVQGRGGDIFAAGYLWQWATNHPAFENIEGRDVWLPTVPGNHSEYPGEFYALLRENVSSFLRAGKPLICGSGLSEEDFEFLRDQTLWELHHSDETQFTRLQCLWASKRMDYVDPPNEA